MTSAATMTSAARCQVPGADPWRRPPADGIEGLQLGMSDRATGPRPDRAADRHRGDDDQRGPLPGSRRRSV
jgi:hypothetical protein